MDLFGSFYSHHLNPDELLSLVDLKEKTNVFVNHLSGGQRQRFSIIASLINDPEIVFLDEPTTGLDPLARRHLWEIITKIKLKGKTIILTTHYMEEAEVLCDRVAIMDKGKIIAMDEIHKLIERAKKPFKIDFISPKITKKEIENLSKLGDIENITGKSDFYEMKLKTQGNLNAALGLIQKIHPESLVVRRASLEDLFIELTGKRIEE